ncbi:MAG TPA: hypothetical protein VM753_04580 [Anaeromyxobacter sp.]|jgi:hypothetical protein|nr:hypothetical protein [Anaeromyxobacter sp.]
MAPPTEMRARRLDLRRDAPSAATMPAATTRAHPEPGEEAAALPAPTAIAAPPRPWLLALAARAARLLRRVDARTSVRARDVDGPW